MVAKVGVLGPPKCRKAGNCSNRWGTKHRSSILETLLWTCFLGFTTIYSCVDIVPKVFFHCQGIFLPAYSWTWNHRGPDSTTNPQPKLQIFSFGLGISSSSKSKIVLDVSWCFSMCCCVFSCKHRSISFRRFRSWCRGAGGDGPHHDALSEPHYRLFVVWNGILERSGGVVVSLSHGKAIPGTSPGTNSKKWEHIWWIDEHAFCCFFFASHFLFIFGKP